LYQAVPAVNLQADNATVLQTLDSLAGGTGIAYEVRDDSVRLYKAQAGAGAAPAARNDAIIGRVTVPVGTTGTMIDWYIRESDLTPEQDDLRNKALQEAKDALQRAGTMPAAPAATGPATTTKE
jgi:hypothetical protein